MANLDKEMLQAALSQATEEQLLSALLALRPPTTGPRSSTHDPETVLQSVIGIGADNTAYVILHTDDVEALSKLGEAK